MGERMKKVRRSIHVGRSATRFLDQWPIYLSVFLPRTGSESVNPVATHRVLGSTRRDPKYQDDEERTADLQLGPRRIPSTCARHTRVNIEEDRARTCVCVHTRKRRRETLLSTYRRHMGAPMATITRFIIRIFLSPRALFPLSLVGIYRGPRRILLLPILLLPFHERFSSISPPRPPLSPFAPPSLSLSLSLFLSTCTHRRAARCF